MRKLLSVAVVCVGCATTPPPPTELKPPAPVKVDFSNLFGGSASRSIYDPRVAQPGLMDRVLVEPRLLAENEPEKGIEGWTRRRLLQALGQRGAVVMARLPSAKLEPTAALRNIRFISGQDEVNVRVERTGPGIYTVWLRQAPDEPSLCPAGFVLSMGFVQLQGQALRAEDGAIAADLQELALLEPPKQAVVQARLPPPEQQADFCAQIAALFRAAPPLQRTSARFEQAAGQVLKSLEPLFRKRSARLR